MTDKYADLRAALDDGWVQSIHPNTVRTLLDDYDRMREALRRLEKGFKAGRENANAMFRESGNVYHEGRRTAYDQAASDVRAALAQEGS